MWDNHLKNEHFRNADMSTCLTAIVSQGALEVFWLYLLPLLHEMLRPVYDLLTYYIRHSTVTKWCLLKSVLMKWRLQSEHHPRQVLRPESIPDINTQNRNGWPCAGCVPEVFKDASYITPRVIKVDLDIWCPIILTYFQPISDIETLGEARGVTTAVPSQLHWWSST